MSVVTMLWQRDAMTGRACLDGVLNMDYPPIPSATEFQHHAGFGYKTPVSVIGWDWSVTFGRWSALVRFADGWQGFTWPKDSVQNKMSCRVLRDAFFGENREEVFAAIPDLPEEAFGACKCALLVPFAERLGLVPTDEMVVPEGVTQILYHVGKQSLPWDGPYMEETEPIPQGIELGDCSIKEHIVAKCIMTGNRYGVCWFRDFL